MSDLAWLTARPIAHRGYHDLNDRRWENTLSAFDAAADRNFAIECDVHLSKDGVPIVFHDLALKRLTGEQGTIVERTASEMCALRIGGTEDYVPTLEQMLERVAGRVPVVIELKGIEGHDDGLVAKVGALLAAYGGEAAIMSFNHWLVRQFAEDAPGVPAGLTAFGAQPEHMEAHFSMLAHGISFASYHAADLPNRFTSFLREKLSMPVITWTVRDRATYDLTKAHADQMTFEGFDPDDPSSVAQLR
ncbi:MAG: glycerophosphodiester phosphodiesterase [Rhizobiaceae bacterium]|nr:glycerophosphodiester phosphodiesterase [Rhizobiaceae bacterium]